VNSWSGVRIERVRGFITVYSTAAAALGPVHVALGVLPESYVVPAGSLAGATPKARFEPWHAYEVFDDLAAVITGQSAYAPVGVFTRQLDLSTSRVLRGPDQQYQFVADNQGVNTCAVQLVLLVLTSGI